MNVMLLNLSHLLPKIVKDGGSGRQLRSPSVTQISSKQTHTDRHRKLEMMSTNSLRQVSINMTIS